MKYLKALVAVPGISDTDDEKMAAEKDSGEIFKKRSRIFQVLSGEFLERS